MMMRANENRKKRKWLKTKLRTVVVGSNGDLKKLRFEELYGACYQLCLHRDGKKLLTLFNQTLKWTASVYARDEEEYTRRALMVTDIFMFAVSTRFGMHLQGENDRKQLIENVWEGRRVLRTRVAA
jgi:hypothetical protein